MARVSCDALYTMPDSVEMNVQNGQAAPCRTHPDPGTPGSWPQPQPPVPHSRAQCTLELDCKPAGKNGWQHLTAAPKERLGPQKQKQKQNETAAAQNGPGDKGGGTTTTKAHGTPARPSDSRSICAAARPETNHINTTKRHSPGQNARPTATRIPPGPSLGARRPGGGWASLT